MTDNEVIGITKYFERLLEEQRIYFLARLDAMDKASCHASETLNKRLEGMNEFRSALKDQNATFVPRVEYGTNHKKLEEEISDLRESRAELKGKASQQSVNIAWAFSVIAALISIISLIIHLQG